MSRSERPTGVVRYDNRGRVVLVSGGASGIGHAICQAFVDSGASVVCLDICQPEIDSLTAEVAAVFGDTSREEDCRRAVEFAVETFGGLDVLVNNAAIQPKESYRPLHELETQVWQRMVDVNFTGYTLLAKQAIPVMLRQRSGVIINLSSGQGGRTARQVAAYGPIKAANRMQARQWGVEYARDGIRVLSVSPGAIDTPLVRATLAQQGGGEELANRHPLGRIGRPEEIASAVLWLSSDDASFITATDVEVDGGLGAFGAFADPYPKSTLSQS
ncbi:MAG: SDR family oxidoreductase [Planctomycetaceae bacterium]|nr:MAG: SDR family oxidoreductase [Planctomycetaceae bacterium]